MNRIARCVQPMSIKGLLWLSALVFVTGLQAQAADITLESRVTGNQEQPKVLYIVPWKSPGTASDLFVPLQSQLSAVFEHVERPELVREMNYQQLLEEPQGEGSLE